MFYIPFPTYSFLETTQIWGKEFSGSMFFMIPANSLFFSCLAVYFAETQRCAI
jgi:hypothetical protein